MIHMEAFCFKARTMTLKYIPFLCRKQISVSRFYKAETKVGPMEHFLVGRLQRSRWSVAAPKMVKNRLGATPLLRWERVPGPGSLERAWWPWQQSVGLAV